MYTNTLAKFLLVATITSAFGCSTQQTSVRNMFDGFGSQHQACYGYWTGTQGVEKDVEKAVDWCTRGHEAGDVLSTALLGEMLFDGRDIERDLQGARAYFHDASLKGDRDSGYMVFVCTLAIALGGTSQTIRDELEFAEGHLELAAGRGSERAAEMLELWRSNNRDVENILKSVESTDVRIIHRSAVNENRTMSEILGDIE